MILTDYRYEKPRTLQTLFDLMREENAKLLAGGTDFILQMREGKAAPSLVIDIKGIEELRGIYRIGSRLFIGAAEPVQSVVEHPLTQGYRALTEGANSLGCYEIRWRATIGGNICNGSPSADTVPGLLVYDADAVLLSASGERTVPLESLLLGPGRVDLRPGELLRGVLLDEPRAGSQSRYYRRSRVKGMDLSGLSAAVYCEGFSAFRIAFGAAWPTVARAKDAEKILNGAPFTRELLDEAMRAILEDIKPRSSSLRASPDYKRAMVPELVKIAIVDMNGGFPA